jgi:hypothetical protein
VQTLNKNAAWGEAGSEGRVSYAAALLRPASLHWICSGRFFLFLISLFNSFLYSLAQLQARSLKRERITGGFLKLFDFFLFWTVQLRGLQSCWSFIPKSAGRGGGAIVLGGMDLETLWRRMELFYLFSLFRFSYKKGRGGFQVLARKSEVKK